MGKPRIKKWIDWRRVSSKLPPLLEAVYLEISRRPANLHALKAALECLLSFLASPEGRTNANCRATDTFFCLREGWDADWEHLPQALRDVLDDMGHALHDTVTAPHIAEESGCTPEQLLARVHQIDIDIGSA
ncbi:MAG: hypothetical protein ACYS8L_01915 [Planctomycetota bacterium]|jgi:hypothetical protein